MSERTCDFDRVKAEKESAMLRYKRLKNVTNLLRLVEACALLVLLSWTLTRLPFAVKISGEFFRRAAGVMASPLFVFAICNAIIAALIGRFSGENRGANNAAGAVNVAEAQVYEDYVKNSDCINNNGVSDDNNSNNSDNYDNPGSPGTTLLSENPLEILESKTVEEVTFQDKQIIVVSGANANSDVARESGSEEDDWSPVTSVEDPRTFRRTKSEKLGRGQRVKGKVLRRAETEKCMDSCPEDELSDEEFQRAVDEFIAKHLSFRRQESFVFYSSKPELGC